jgi:chromosome segregation ATPase
MGVMMVTAQPLDRRREKAGNANTAADKARAAVRDLDDQLKTIAGLTEQQQQSLRRAQDEVARLKRALKAAAKRRAELVQQRRKAVAKADRAKARAEAAEAKYDKEVLAALVRREKEKDRTAAAPPPAPADPEPEQPREATTTARKTAARKTAARASA